MTSSCISCLSMWISLSNVSFPAASSIWNRFFAALLDFDELSRVARRWPLCAADAAERSAPHKCGR